MHCQNGDWWTIERINSVNNIKIKRSKDSIKHGIIDYFVVKNQSLTQEEKNEFEDTSESFDQPKKTKKLVTSLLFYLPFICLFVFFFCFLFYFAKHEQGCSYSFLTFVFISFVFENTQNTKQS